MTEKLNRVVAEVTSDGLLDAAYANHKVGVTILAGQGELKRGTVLATNEANKCVILGTAKAEGETNNPVAKYILAKDVDASGNSDVVAIAYDEARVIKQHLIVKTNYTITAADLDNLRVHNICVAEEL